mmetsp:Transcript_41725/g.97940  ORF Transcript_41725/g.97940 Transcript_41725/m.97940 type:complete len:212 (+) Transcript_41725:428-1063(+)
MAWLVRGRRINEMRDAGEPRRDQVTPAERGRSPAHAVKAVHAQLGYEHLMVRQHLALAQHRVRRSQQPVCNRSVCEVARPGDVGADIAARLNAVLPFAHIMRIAPRQQQRLRCCCRRDGAQQFPDEGAPRAWHQYVGLDEKNLAVVLASAPDNPHDFGKARGPRAEGFECLCAVAVSREDRVGVVPRLACAGRIAHCVHPGPRAHAPPGSR